MIMKHHQSAAEGTSQHNGQRNTYHRWQLRQRGRKNPEQALEVQHVPKMCRIPLVKHTIYHDHQQNGVLDEIHQYTPSVLICAAERTCAENRRPYGSTLSDTRWY